MTSKRVKHFIVSSFIALGILLFISPTSSHAATYYVSRTGSNGDGKSWATAWSELSNINWNSVVAGDTITLDGGATSCPSAYDFVNHSTNRPGLSCGMLYTTALTVPKNGTAPAPITIQLSTDSGRNGTAVVFGGRTTPLPYCGQSGYSASGTARDAGINLDGRSYITIDGKKRSGIMVYGAKMGVSMVSDSESFVTLRNMEIFDNGIYSSSGGITNSGNPGVGFAGHDLTFERLLVHDNSEDEFQDQATLGSSHAALYNITLKDSWLYSRRSNPNSSGWPFTSGPGEACAHVDGVQVWAGGSTQHNFNVENVVFGPLLGQGFYPGDAGGVAFSNVIIKNSLFINARAQNINSDSVSATKSWNIQNVTSYEIGGVPGALDLSGSSHSITQSIFMGGYLSASGVTGSGNIYYNTDSVAGGTNTNPQFVGPLPSSAEATYDQLVNANFTPSCSSCSGKGSSIHKVSDVLALIDSLNGVVSTATPIPTLTPAPTLTPTRTPTPTPTPVSTTATPTSVVSSPTPAVTFSYFMTVLRSYTTNVSGYDSDGDGKITIRDLVSILKVLP